MERTLDLANLHHLDNGKGALAFSHAMRQIVKDIQDRPGDKAKRKVVLTVEGTPSLDNDSAVLDTIGIRINVKTSIPNRQTVEYPMLPQADGRLVFQEHSPGDPRQSSLAFPAGGGDDPEPDDDGDETEVL